MHESDSCYRERTRYHCESLVIVAKDYEDRKHSE